MKPDPKKTVAQSGPPPASRRRIHLSVSSTVLERGLARAEALGFTDLSHFVEQLIRDAVAGETGHQDAKPPGKE